MNTNKFWITNLVGFLVTLFISQLNLFQHPMDWLALDVIVVVSLHAVWAWQETTSLPTRSRISVASCLIFLNVIYFPYYMWARTARHGFASSLGKGLLTYFLFVSSVVWLATAIETARANLITSISRFEKIVTGAEPEPVVTVEPTPDVPVAPSTGQLLNAFNAYCRAELSINSTVKEAASQCEEYSARYAACLVKTKDSVACGRVAMKPEGYLESQ